MKKKNVVLALVAMTFAVASAFAAVLTPQNIFVKARIGSSGATLKCVDTKVQCEPTGGVACRVQVSTSHAGQQTATSTGTFKTYESTCSTPLQNDVNTTLIAAPTESIYELTNDF